MDQDVAHQLARLLEAKMELEGIGLRGIARGAGVPPAAIHRLLHKRRSSIPNITKIGNWLGMELVLRRRA